MTARRKDDGTLEIVKLGLGTNGFRIFVVVAVLSMHPVGRNILDSLGFEFPDTQRQEAVVQQATLLRHDMTTLKQNVVDIHNAVDGVKQDVAVLKANSAITQEKLDKLVKP